MIIISNKPGQLANLLFIYSSFLAYGLESGTRILNPAFFNYRSYFKGTAGLLHMNRGLYALCFIIARILDKTGIHKGPIIVVALRNGEQALIDNDPRFGKLLCFAQGWLFRCNTLLVKHRKTLLDFFSPAPALQQRLDDFFSTQLSSAEFIVAVHIRRGDYKNFQDGRFYYSIDQYERIIGQLSALFEKTKPVFLICSNEVVQFTPEFTQRLNILPGPGHELLDLYAMARCHYIIGPPSTYSMWASFAGNVPLHLLHDPDQAVSLDDFTIYQP